MTSDYSKWTVTAGDIEGIDEFKSIAGNYSFLDALVKLSKDDVLSIQNMAKDLGANDAYKTMQYLCDQARIERYKALKSMPYKDYLETPEWQERRQKHLRSCHFKCQLCGKGKIKLDVHHNSYANKGDEPKQDLIALCRECHEAHHKRTNAHLREI